MIKAVALEKGEESMNLLFESEETQTQEIICFDTPKFIVWL